MSGETDLSKLIRNMSPFLDNTEYVFCSLHPDDQIIERLSVLSTFREEENLSLIIPRNQAEEYHLNYNGVYRKITLNIHSSLEAVGFLSCITTELTKHNIPANAVSAYYHDHLFIPADRADECMQALHKMRMTNMQ